MQLRFRKLATVLAAALLLEAATGSAQEPVSDSAGPLLFRDNSLIEIELTGPLDAVLADTEERNRRSMVLQVGGRSLDVEVRIRGNSRLRVCKFPPLRVYFGEDTAGTPFESLKSLKLVTHCFNSESGDKNVADEYAAYRIFGLLTPYAYQTRPMRVTYHDTDGNSDDSRVERYAFFLESRSLLAARIHGQRVDLSGISLGQLERLQAARMYIFQYLIGNTDWSLVTSENDEHCCHNVDLISRNDLIYTIPYDFDLAGIVNAPYAKPDPSLRLKRVTMRRYRGYCIESEHLEMALSEIRDYREAITAELRQIPIADSSQISDMIAYLESFFRQAEKDKKLLARFEKRCL